jgi:arginine deiminase
VTEYHPNGNVFKTDTKLLEYLGISKDKVVHVGGRRESYNSGVEHAFYALRELRNQAGNVLSLRPRVQLAYSYGDNTLAELEAKGMKVYNFKARELKNWNGGPHCLSMPLWRE